MSNTASRVHVLIPVLDDWIALDMLLCQLDGVMADAGCDVDVLVVDDGSASVPDRLGPVTPRSIRSIACLRLRRNLGHQRAIAIGLTWLTLHRDPPMVVVMDGDGEDDPRDVPRLIRACVDAKSSRVVFAQRARRSEGLFFKAGYSVYRAAHRLLVGRDIRVGNFSVVPRTCLQRLLVVSELWNHYAAAVLEARIPNGEVPTERARRLHGEPRMNFVRLVTHGLSALSVYSEVIGTRLLMASATLIALSLAGIAVVLGMRVFDAFIVPGWTSIFLTLMFVLLVHGIMGALMFAFLTLSVRSSMRFVPVRDHAHFVLEVVTLGGTPPADQRP